MSNYDYKNEDPPLWQKKQDEFIDKICTPVFANCSSYDSVNKPKHYNIHPSGVECIQITEYMNFCLGNAIKYIWRAGIKESDKSEEDLRKAKWYIDRELKRLGDNDVDS